MIEMRSIFGLNYFVFCITALVLILYCTKDMRDEGFYNTGALVQLAASHVPSTRKCNFGGIFSGWGEPFVNTFPQLEYSTKVNKVERKVDKQIYDDLTTQGIMNMTESKYNPYHCSKELME